MKKFFSLVLALVMALSLTTVAWGADCAHNTLGPETTENGLTYAECGDHYVVTNATNVVLTGNVTIDKKIYIKSNIEIDLGTYTITGTANRLFRIDDGVTVTFKNGTIKNDVSGGRCIETRGGDVTLNLNGVTLTATNGASQPLTIGGSGDDIVVNITGSTITAGMGYAITTFNPVEMTITNSTVSGYAALNIKVADDSLGSAGSTFNVVGSILKSVNNVPNDPSNSFCTVMVEDDNVTINVDATSTLIAEEETNGQCIFGIGNSTISNVVEDVDINVADGAELEGTILGHHDGSLGGVAQDVAESTVTVPAEYADEMAAAGYVVTVDANGQVVATGVSAPAPAGGTALTKTYDLLTTDASETKTVMVTVTTYAAKAAKDRDKTGYIDQADDLGIVKHVVFSNLPGQYFVQVNSVKQADYIVYEQGTKTVFGYFAEVASPTYLGNGVAFYDFGAKCGQYDDTPEVDAKYYIFEGTLFQADETYASPINLMVGSKLTPVDVVADFTDVKWVGHTAVYTYDKDYTVTAIKCGECGTPAVIYPNLASVPKADKLARNVFSVNGDEWFCWLAGPVADAETEDPKVESADTFDAGIAMYVSMSVMAAAGGAVVIGKKKD